MKEKDIKVHIKLKIKIHKATKIKDKKVIRKK